MNKLTDFEINEKIISAFTDIVGINSEINIHTEIETLMLDSLDEVELIMHLENKFNISINDDYAETMLQNVVFIKDIKKILKEKFKIYDIKEDRKLKIISVIESSN